MDTHLYTAAILIIGNEILSGRTQDKNTPFLGTALNDLGIHVREVRVVADTTDMIVTAVNDLRQTYDYIFTTGGIGPTHDDITADSIAKAFDVAISEHAEAKHILKHYYKKQGQELNPGRLRMARIPHGASLIQNDVSGAPGFKIENVYVMAGVPPIMQNMFSHIAPTLKGGQSIKSISLVCHVGESALSTPLRKLQDEFPEIDMGSYPGGGENGKPKVTLVFRHTDLAHIERAITRGEALLPPFTRL